MTIIISIITWSFFSLTLRLNVQHSQCPQLCLDHVFHHLCGLWSLGQMRCHPRPGCLFPVGRASVCALTSDMDRGECWTPALASPQAFISLLANCVYVWSSRKLMAYSSQNFCLTQRNIHSTFLYWSVWWLLWSPPESTHSASRPYGKVMIFRVTQSFTSWVTLNELLHLSEPQVPHL